MLIIKNFNPTRSQFRTCQAYREPIVRIKNFVIRYVINIKALLKLCTCASFKLRAMAISRSSFSFVKSITSATRMKMKHKEEIKSNFKTIHTKITVLSFYKYVHSENIDKYSHPCLAM